MKRAASGGVAARKRLCTGASPDSGSKRSQPPSQQLPPLSLAQGLSSGPEGVRSTSDCASQQPCCGCCVRSRDQSATVHAPRAARSPSYQSSPLPALTEEALNILQRSLVDCNTERFFADMEAVAAPPTPRSASSYDRRRARRSTRSHGARTPSPSKKPTPQTYRTRNMYHSNVLIEHLEELPLRIDTEIQRMLSSEAIEEHRALLDRAATMYRLESRQNTRDCALESEWKASLFQLIKQLLNPAAGLLKAHMSEKVWNPALKPTGPRPSPYPSNDEEDGGTRAIPCSEDGIETIWSAPSLPPSTAGTSNTEAADPYYISTPKPDITIGLAHTGFEQHQQWRLIDHQASGTILSDPHAADMGLRFPFLIVEAKGLSQNGSLVAAQNQAAISGACMLAILQDLHNHANGSHSTFEGSIALPDLAPLCFSIVTAGAIHEIYVHFMYNDAIHMHCIRSFRTFSEHESRSFVCCLFQILEWGSKVFRRSISEKIDRTPRRGAAGVPQQ